MNRFKGVLVLFICLLSLTSLANKQDSILLEGSIYNNVDRVKHAEIKVYIGNQLYKVVKVRSSNRFRTYLPKNEQLMIEITAPNFHEKRFVFDSSIPDELTRMPAYTFDMDIFREEELEGVNPSALDFPAGIVYYDKKKNRFVHDKSYTKKIKKVYFSLLDEAKMVQRSALEKDE